MAVTENQKLLLQSLVKISEEKGVQTFCHRAEWLGYMPFGIYKRLETDGGIDVTESVNCDFDEADILALDAGKFIRVLAKEENISENDGTNDVKITFSLLEAKI